MKSPKKIISSKNFILCLFYRFTIPTILALLLSICGGNLFAQVTEEWVARYHRFEDDIARAIAVDANGNVYVTGQSEFTGFSPDFATIKYDANGNQLWVARYETSAPDYPKGIAVDNQGNVYVTGWAYGSGNGADYTTIKYDPNGNQLWIAYFGQGGDEGANALAVDENGNVYVTGSAALGTYDCATVKYDAAGNQLWVQTYDGSAHIDDGGVDIALDENGNVYIVGTAMDTLTYYNFLIISYDPGGNTRWITKFNAPDSALDEGYAIAVKNGRVCVTGRSYHGSLYYDYATVCYDINGALLWWDRYNGPGNGGDEPSAIAIDEDGNVYVTGKSSGAGTFFDYATIKYAPDGTVLWVARYNGTANSTDEASDIALDSDGNVYVTGRSKTSDSWYDYVTIKYDNNGNELWVQNYNGTGNYYDEAHALVVDGNNNVYVTGESEGSGTDLDFATIKYSQPTGIKEPLPNTEFIPSFPRVVSVTRMFHDRINIKFSKTFHQPLQIRMFDILGRQIYSNTYSSIPKSITVSGETISRLPSGLYILDFSSGKRHIRGMQVMKIK